MSYSRRQMKLLATVLFSILLGSTTVLSQTLIPEPEFMRGKMVPRHLQAALVSGIEQFVAAQRNRQRETVWSMMPLSTTPVDATKSCLLDQIMSAPMVTFRPIRMSVTASNHREPLSQRWWLIDGIGEFDNGRGISEKTVSLTARYIGDKWYFTPPSYDDEWEKKYVPLDTPSSELVRFVDIEQPPHSPVRIEDLTVTIDPEHRSSRKTVFKIRNLSRKTIINVSYRIGCTWVGSGVTIGPGETATIEIKVSAYRYFCQGEQARRILVDWVRFSNRSEWRTLTPKDCNL